MTAILGFVFSKEIVSLFRKEDAEVIAIGSLAMRMQFAALILQPLFVSTNMLFQSTGCAVRGDLPGLEQAGALLYPADPDPSKDLWHHRSTDDSACL